MPFIPIGNDLVYEHYEGEGVKSNDSDDGFSTDIFRIKHDTG
jgi:hypothetical protein